jgi:hypothetical protein
MLGALGRSTLLDWSFVCAHRMSPQCETIITCLNPLLLLPSHCFQHPHRYAVATMATAIFLALFVALAHARSMPPLPPIVIRDGLGDVYNTVKNAGLPAGHNTTYFSAESARTYDTVAYKMYVAFMIFGTVSAALLLPVVYSPNAIHWWRQKQHRESNKQRKEDVAEAAMRTREMCESMPPPPAEAYIRPERAVRPGTNFF